MSPQDVSLSQRISDIVPVTKAPVAVSAASRLHAMGVPIPESILSKAARADSHRRLGAMAFRFRREGLSPDEAHKRLHEFNTKELDNAVSPDAFEIILRTFYPRPSDIARAFKSPRLKGVTMVTASQVEDRPVDFLWPGYIVQGLNNLTGDGGHGKGYIAADLAARVSRGDQFPDGTPNLRGPGHVMIFEKEDQSSTLKHRLVQQRADCDRVHFIRGPFALASEMLEAWGEEMKAKYPSLALVIFSPLNSYVPAKMDWRSDPDVRRVMDPLAEFAERFNVAVLVLTHVGKDREKKAQQLTLGSVAYVNAPRVSLGSIATPAIAKLGEPRPATPGRFGMVKFNEGPFPSTLAFSIDDDGLHWEGPTDEDMRTLLEQRKKVEAVASKMDAAEQFLHARLFPNLRERRKHLVADAEREGICSYKTLDRAKEHLPIDSDGDDWVGRWPQ